MDNGEMIFEVTKMEKTKYGYLMTVKDTDETKTKHRNHTSLVDDPSRFPIGSMVRFNPEPVD